MTAGGGTLSRLGAGSSAAMMATDGGGVHNPRTMTGMREYDSAYDDEYSSSRDGVLKPRFGPGGAPGANDGTIYGVPIMGQPQSMSSSYPGSSTIAQQQQRERIYNNPIHLHHHQPRDYHRDHVPHIVHGPRRMTGDGYNDPVYINDRRMAMGGRVDHKMLINVGGVRHEVLWSTLEKFPNTRLGRLQECRTEESILNYCDYYNYDDNEYFFDKNPKIFNSVISCYRIGKLHIPDEYCLTELVTELRYWGFDENYLDMCCQQKYKGRKVLYQEMRSDAEAELYNSYNQYQLGMNGLIPGMIYNPDGTMAMGGMYDERFGIGQCAAYRKFLFDSYENPRYSKTTKVSTLELFLIHSDFFIFWYIRYIPLVYCSAFFITLHGVLFTCSRTLFF